MILPKAVLSSVTAAALAPVHTLHYLSVDSALDQGELRTMAAEAARWPTKVRVARALCLGLQRAVAAARSESRVTAVGVGHDLAESLDLPALPPGRVHTRRLADGSIETYGDDLSEGVEAISLLTTYCLLLAAYYLLFTVDHSLLTAHCSPRTAHYSPLTAHYSLITTHHPPFTTQYLILTTHYSLLTTHYSLLTTQ